MSSVDYHMKVVFRTRPEARAALPRIREFLTEASDACDYWQEHRHLERTPGRRGEFWEGFRGRLPAVHRYLEHLGRANGDCDSALVGLLDFGARVGLKEQLTLSREQPAVLYRAEVWHGSDWDGLEGFLKEELGAVRAPWLSEEWLDEVARML